jgi:thiol:disulfide interchange protein DsbD
VAALLALLLGLALAVHGLGRAAARPALRTTLAAASIALVLAAPNWIVPQASPEAKAPTAHVAAPWSPAEVERLRAEGRPLLVVFGADWCLTCQWNEHRVLESEAVQRALARGGWAVLRADWTQRDEAIRRELLRFGKAGVPLTLVYRPGAAEPQVLPELLGVEGVVAALDVGEADHAQGVREADAS